MLIEFIGYAADCTITGQLELETERLSDQLNRDPTYVIYDANLESLDDGRVVTVSRLTLDRRDLLAVAANGPRGPEARRIHTVRHRLQVQLGSYTVLGHLHVMPGAAPLRSVGARRRMVPLTNATIAYVRAGIVEMQDVEALIVNGEQARWVREPTDERTGALGMPQASQPQVELS
jgi:hypothetical protein